MNSRFLKFSLFTFSLVLVYMFANGAIRFFGGNAMASGVALEEFNDPEITGPDRLCIQFGSVIGEFSGGGDPDTDVYDWKIFDESGQTVFDKEGGFPTISVTFKDPGSYRIELIVKRASIPLPTQTKNIVVQPAPNVLLNSSYQLCGADPLELNAIDPNDPTLSLFEFEWKDGSGDVIGNNNTLIVTTPGTYTVDFFIPSTDGFQDCVRSLSTSITDSSVFDIEAPSNIICPNQALEYTSSTGIPGNWYIQKEGEARTLLASGNSVTISPGNSLGTPGNYEVIFEVINPDVAGCALEKSEPLTYFPLPDFEILDPIGASGCNVADGAIRIRALTNIDGITVDDGDLSTLPISTPSLSIGEEWVIPNLESGAFELTAFLGSCSNPYAAVVPIDVIPPQLEYELTNIVGESCTDTGKELGSFIIELTNGPSDGHYRVVNEKGSTAAQGSFLNQSEIPVSIPGGSFVVEILDLDSCKVPKEELIEIPGKNQVNFSIPTELSICQSFELEPDTQQDLEFTLIAPDGTEEVKQVGESFTLTQAGTHQVVGRPESTSDLCPLLRELEVTLVDPVDFEPELVQEDCFGNRTFEADIFGRDPEDLLFTWYNENDEIVSEGIQLIPTSTGLFKLDVQPKNSEACPIPPKEFQIDAPVLEVDVTLGATKLCELKPASIITLETTFQDEVTDIVWRRFSETGEVIPLPEFKDQTEITVDLEGIYEATVFSIIPAIGKDCELGRNSIEVDVTPDRVIFDIPESLSICESYDFSPETTQNLDFTVTYPNGEMITKSSTETFLLNQEGTYTFFGFDPDTGSLLCPDEQTIEVKVNRKIDFEPVLIDETCAGIKTYQAVLSGTDPSQAVFSWLDDQGNEIGNEEFLILDDFGTFGLDVQPLGSIPCDQDINEFEVAEPILSVDVNLVAETLCPDATSAAISVESDFDTIERLEWWFTDVSGVESQLVNETGNQEILALEEGTYEARVFNEFDCILGFDRALILRSTDEVRPVVMETYQVCPRYEIAETINPGQFASYEWYHEGDLVSTNPTYKPLLIGDFELIVFSNEGCAYQTTFTTEEECELREMHPTAIQPGNPDKEFLVYTNYLIDELEVYIFNKWGQTIFQCSNTDLLSEESTCGWDGTFDGKAIPNGSYTIRINYRNLEKNIEKYYLGSILVIE